MHQDIRLGQMQPLFRARWPEALGISVGDYKSSIPDPPERKLIPGRFCDLILVDRRVTIRQACEGLGVAYTGPDFEPPSSMSQNPPNVEWMYCQADENFNQNCHECSQTFPSDECGLDCIEGLCLFAQNPLLLVNRCILLARSLPSHHVKLSQTKNRLGKPCLQPNEVGCACLQVKNGQPELTWVWGHGKGERFCVASRLKW